MAKKVYEEVVAALEALSKDGLQPQESIFRPYFRASTVADLAQCSAPTARRHLNTVAQYRGYTKRKVYGVYGYRYDEWLADA